MDLKPVVGADEREEDALVGGADILDSVFGEIDAPNETFSRLGVSDDCSVPGFPLDARPFSNRGIPRFDLLDSPKIDCTKS